MQPARHAFRPIEHEHRAFLDSETHARPVAPLEAPLRIRRAAFMADSDRGQLAALQANLMARLGSGPGATDARQLDFEAGGYKVTAELHNEFATMTWAGPIDDWTPWPDGIHLDLFADMPLIAAARIDLTATPTVDAAALAGFNTQSLCHSDILQGGAQAATDFLKDDDGFTRFEVAAGRAGALRRGVIVRRLLEIETYRNLALLGLPLARKVSPRIQHQERTLADLMRRLGEGHGMDASNQALDTLHRLSLDVGRTLDEVSYRFAASRAYADVLRARLDRLEESPVGEFSTIARYLENRIEPAIATLTAINKRLDALSGRLERSTDLLNARISLGIEKQNQQVLDTISNTARSQFLLQQTVEGLSIIAISYYTLGVLGYLLEGAHDVLPLGKPTLLALAAPLVIIVVWAMLRRRRPPHG